MNEPASQAVTDAASSKQTIQSLSVDQLRTALIQAQQALAKAETANRAKDAFFNLVSHELRTPLTPILLTIGLLDRNEELPASAREDLVMIRQSVGTEVRLIDEMLEISRVIRGAIKLKPVVTDLHESIRAAIEKNKPDPDEPHAEMRVELNAKNSRVTGDPARLQQIIGHLVRNALRFTPNTGQILVVTDNPQPGTIRLRVQDNGVGIEPSRLPTMFEPFAHSLRPGQTGGIGVGLSVSHWLAKAHNGQLSVDSKGENCGACFTLTLPVAK